MTRRTVSPEAAARMVEQAERRNRAKTHGGRWPASGARVKHPDGSTSKEVSLAEAARIVVKKGGEVVNAHTGETLSPEVAAKAAKLPLTSPELKD